jgi:hypothetical protein
LSALTASGRELFRITIPLVAAGSRAVRLQAGSLPL